MMAKLFLTGRSFNPRIKILPAKTSRDDFDALCKTEEAMEGGIIYFSTVILLLRCSSLLAVVSCIPKFVM